MKILLLGAKGQLGQQIIKIIKEKKSELGSLPKDIINAELVCMDIDDLDITNIDQVKSILNKEKPNIIINSAAFTNVDGCESNYDLAFKVNALGGRNLAIVSEEIGAKLVHISTDYVFDGKGSSPLKECDITVPISAYGKTKLLGENYVKDFCSRYFIVRTAWLYGYFGKNFVYTIMNAGRERGKLTVVNDQRGNPTNAEDLAYHVLKLAVTEEYGIYHCTGDGECTWYDFASKIIEYSGIDCEVLPVTSDEYKTPAKRPEYSSLDNMMLRNTIGDEMREWEEALKCFMNNKDKYTK
ncbi:dTDP-4-dehydrorhamnose reductase [Clostridium septicum]|uniref:dTDP-4-dehydrorhamnose reductase n=1 Tax=Clostridium septicum TaxID=1504 RepID=A0A9N7PJQ4_CLOSE|nr:dTDP-4-dehydrorhamnose reductase [Clostridium septicum]AYE34890.1 dTDP-4-dehydrorhamnose reductase [Clostridium septicum]QAS60285.1 dTDP-4-dehydrorhamnose reductase [Clostridium septicum]UEC20460.1 dTDP-4-dehydrorhamnose reductase [Clostridium septicum]USS01484.1 dTDP-4-dehydrorhamnose reductase [Clostridium septicum]